MGWSQGKIAEAKARHHHHHPITTTPPSSKPGVIQRPYSPMAYACAAGLRRRSPPITHNIRHQSHTISAASHTQYRPPVTCQLSRVGHHPSPHPPSSKPGVIQRPYCGYATPHRFGAPPRAHTHQTPHPHAT